MFRKQGPWVSVATPSQMWETWHRFPFFLFYCPASLGAQGLGSSTLVVRLSWVCSPWVPWTDLHFLLYLCIFFTDGSKHLEICLLPQVFPSSSEKGSEVYSSHRFICRKHRAQLYQRLFAHISWSSQNFCKSTLHSRRKLPDWALQVSAFTPLKLRGCLLAEVLIVKQLPIGYQMNS